MDPRFCVNPGCFLPLQLARFCAVTDIHCHLLGNESKALVSDAEMGTIMMPVLNATLFSKKIFYFVQLSQNEFRVLIYLTFMQNLIFIFWKVSYGIKDKFQDKSLLICSCALCKVRSINLCCWCIINQMC